MRVIDIFLELEEVADKINAGVVKGKYPCVKTAINEMTFNFIKAFTSDSAHSLLPAINNMVELYSTLTNAKPIVDPMIHPTQRQLIDALIKECDKLPDNQEVQYMGNTCKCFKTTIKQLIEYYYNDLAYNIYSLDYKKHFSEVYRLLGYLPDGHKLL